MNSYEKSASQFWFWENDVIIPLIFSKPKANDLAATSVVRSPHKTGYFQGYGPMGKYKSPRKRVGTAGNMQRFYNKEVVHMVHGYILKCKC